MTPVLMADGTMRPITQVQVGDLVTATNPATGTTTAEPVTAQHVNQDTDLADVTVRDSSGAIALLHTT
jgi:hypothetical protein